jgi:hypothetical protein
VDRRRCGGEKLHPPSLKSLQVATGETLATQAQEPAWEVVGLCQKRTNGTLVESGVNRGARVRYSDLNEAARVGVGRVGLCVLNQLEDPFMARMRKHNDSPKIRNGYGKLWQG